MGVRVGFMPIMSYVTVAYYSSYHNSGSGNAMAKLHVPISL